MQITATPIHRASGKILIQEDRGEFERIEGMTLLRAVALALRAEFAFRAHGCLIDIKK